MDTPAPEYDRKASAELRGKRRSKTMLPPSRTMGGRIPSPQQSYDVDARSQAIMSRPEMMADPEFGTMRPGMSQEEIDMFNKPQMNISDAFFGPDNGERFDIIAFITNLLRGNR
jgi:hypothetical protein